MGNGEIENKGHSGKFRHTHAYSGIFRHDQAYPGIFRNLSDTSRIWTQNYLVCKQTIWPVLLNGWVFVHKVSGCGFVSRCSPLNFSYCTWLKPEVPRHSDNYRVQIHSETCTWHDSNRQSHSGIIQAYSETCVTLTYSKPWYIQNHDIYKTRGIFRTLVYPKFWHIQNQTHT